MRALAKVVDDTTSFTRELARILSIKIGTRACMDSRPWLKSLGSSGQIEEKVLRQSVALL